MNKQEKVGKYWTSMDIPDWMMTFVYLSNRKLFKMAIASDRQ